ncbi:hypothetical protein [Rhizobium hidalgonense]|uniref:hypothetical protein n=1 Tax=Rhizobium hidalgonense TaxID=1538159 RepID=UPI001FDF1283|nr:hypothetical protein [Rhizobium hidalgonense]
MPTSPRDNDFRMLSEAVQAWYRFYEVDPDERASQTLCTAALEFYQEGYKTAEEVSTLLIGTYVGLWSTRVNSPSSATVH